MSYVYFCDTITKIPNRESSAIIIGRFSLGLREDPSRRPHTARQTRPQVRVAWRGQEPCYAGPRPMNGCVSYFSVLAEYRHDGEAVTDSQTRCASLSTHQSGEDTRRSYSGQLSSWHDTQDRTDCNSLDPLLRLLLCILEALLESSALPGLHAPRLNLLPRFSTLIHDWIAALRCDPTLAAQCQFWLLIAYLFYHW